MLTLHHHLRAFIALILASALATACSVNPVTGKRQLTMPVAEQIRLGNQQYLPSQQQQGGRYVVDPDLNVYVKQVGQAVAAQSEVKLPYEFVVLNNNVPNAWALPGGKIALNRGLLVLLDDEAQLAAVLGHEVVHAAAEHSANQMTRQQILGVGVLAATVAAGAAVEEDKAALIGAGASVGAQAFQAHYGRSQELEADFYGIDYMVSAGYDPDAAVELQQKFVALSKGQQSDLLSNLFASHPPSEERVARNREKASTLPDGKRNRAAFQEAIAQLKKDQPAYDKHQLAEQAAAKGNMDEALALTEQAIKLQPNESLFYVTKGQILFSQDNAAAAKSAFAEANSRNPDYFMGFLGLGICEAQQKNWSAARTALTQSTQLLPTATAVFYLGEVELGSGNREQAVGYYQQAASAGGDIGAAAERRLAQLQPGR